MFRFAPRTCSVHAVDHHHCCLWQSHVATSPATSARRSHPAYCRHNIAFRHQRSAYTGSHEYPNRSTHDAYPGSAVAYQAN